MRLDTGPQWVTKKLVVHLRRNKTALTQGVRGLAEMRMLYMSVVASAFLFAVACWGSRHQQTGLEPDCLMAMSERRMLSKLHVIRDSLLLHDGSGTGLRSVSFHQAAPQNTSGSHSCLGPLNFTTPSSVSDNLSQ